MNFQYPLILIFIPILLLILIPLFYIAKNKNRQNLNLFVGTNSDKLLPHKSKKVKILKDIIILISIVLLTITLARPQKGFIWQEQVTTGIDIVIAVDTSKSMDAIDVTPNRLDRAKLALLELSSNLKGDRIALIPFAGSSFVMTPFTADYTIFNQSVFSLNTETIPKGGTNISSAISTAEDIFKDKNNHKILILVTDGEDLANQGIEEANRVSGEEIQIFTIGVGTTEGELIPDPNNVGSYLKDNRGNIVKSKLDEKSLKEIANVTGGDYRHLSSGGNGILQIYNEKLTELEQENKSEQRSRIPVDKYRWFLLPVIILLLFEFIISSFKTNFKKKMIFTAIFLTSFTTLYGTPADDALKNGDIQQAIDLYKKEKVNSLSQYNLGTAYYKNMDYKNAISTYKEALKKASGELQSKILYNLGNSYYRESQNNQAESRSLLEEALKSYNGSIELGNKDDRVVKNRDYVQKLLDNMDESQDNKQNSENKDQSNESKDQSNESNDQSNESNDQSNESNDQTNESNDQTNESNDQTNESNDQTNESNDQTNESNDQSNESNDQSNKSNDQYNEENEQYNEANEQPGTSDLSAGDQQGVTPQDMTAKEAEALLNSLQGEEADIKYLLNDNNNSYSGEW